MAPKGWNEKWRREIAEPREGRRQRTYRLCPFCLPPLPFQAYPSLSDTYAAYILSCPIFDASKSIHWGSFELSRRGNTARSVIVVGANIPVIAVRTCIWRAAPNQPIVVIIVTDCWETADRPLTIKISFRLFDQKIRWWHDAAARTRYPPDLVSDNLYNRKGLVLQKQALTVFPKELRKSD